MKYLQLLLAVHPVVAQAAGIVASAVAGIAKHLAENGVVDAAVPVVRRLGSHPIVIVRELAVVGGFAPIVLHHVVRDVVLRVLRLTGVVVPVLAGILVLVVIEGS
jgi:hypothetical protein